MGEMHEMYGDWDDGEYNPFDGDVDDDEPTETCVNCGIEFTSAKIRVYCGELCKQEADLVRYVRRCDADGRSDEPDIIEAIEIKLAHVLGGGYDRQGRQLPPDARSDVISRASGKCHICGEAANEIDHVSDGSNDPFNLQLLCHACHMKKSLANLRTVRVEDAEYAEVDAKGKALLARFNAEKPLRDCDDPDEWPKKYKGVLSERRARRRNGG